MKSVAAAGVAVNVLGVGCSSGPPATPAATNLAWAGEGQSEAFGVAMVLPENASIATFGAVTLCLRDLPAATITAVTFGHTKGLRLDRFSIRPADPQNMIGNSVQSLEDLGFPTRPTHVAIRCVDQVRTPGPELAIQVTLDSDSSGEAGDLRVSYTSSERTGTLTIPFNVRICGRQAPAMCTS